MAIKKEIEINVNSKGAEKSFNDLGSVIQEQKDITIEFEKELIRLEKQLKETAKNNLPAQKALKTRITGLKDAIKDQRIAIKGLNNEKGKQVKADNLTLVSATKNYGAITLLDQVTGGYASTVRNAVDASRLFAKSLKATRGALIATGIGAFVVALGLVVAYWDEIKEFVTGTNAELNKQLGLLNTEAEFFERELKILEDTDNILKLKGLTQKEINDLKRKELKSIIDIRNKELQTAKERLEAIREQTKEGIGSVEKIFRYVQERATAVGFMLDKVFGAFGVDSVLAGKAFDASGSVIESIFGTQEDFDETTKRIQDLTDKINSAKNQIAGFDLAAQEEARKRQEEADKRPNVSTVGEGLTAEGFGGNIAEDPEIIFEQSKAERLKQIDDELTQFLMDNANRNRENYEVNAQAKIELEQRGFAILGALAERGSALGKAVAISQAIMSTYQGINKALAETTDPTPTQSLRFANAAAVGIMGFLNVSKILSTQTATTGGSFSGGSANNSGASAPSFNLVQGSGTNQIADGLNSQNEPLRAFVVSGDVTSAQGLDRNIQGDASLG